MPNFPRPKDNFEKLSRKIMGGKPPADRDSRSVKQKKVQQELGHQEIRYVRD